VIAGPRNASFTWRAFCRYAPSGECTSYNRLVDEQFSKNCVAGKNTIQVVLPNASLNRRISEKTKK
jgi:hypothetical protein